jgi:uncharacterized protein YjbI with pentapeptide repeats
MKIKSIKDYSILIYIIIGSATLWVFISLDIKNGITFKELLSNLTASVVEVFLLGIFVAVFNNMRDRKSKETGYKDEIDAFRPWKEEEATYRICGLVRSLNNINARDIDLSFCYLPKGRLSNANLQGANLREANLRGACLNGANLMGANLHKADLEEADLKDANLLTANFKEASLRKAELQRVRLWGAELKGTNLQGANLQEAALTEASLIGASLINANLISAHLMAAELQGADLMGANLQNAYLWGAELQGANFHGATLRRATLQEANLMGVDLSDADLEGAIISINQDQLEKLNIQGIEYIKEKYCIVEIKTEVDPYHILGINIRHKYIFELRRD